MRISQDSSSWRARGILRRDFRHTHDEPEVTKYKVKKRTKVKKKRTKPACKHVWVQVSYQEYCRYAHRSMFWWRKAWIEEYLHDYYEREQKYVNYFVCCGCDKYEQRTDKGKLRVYYRRERAKRIKARQQGR